MPPHAERVHPIEMKLRDMGQLFNTMDPSPFHEKDLDHDAEEYIEGTAAEIPVGKPISLVIRLAEWPHDRDPRTVVEQAVHNYYAYRARMNERAFRLLVREAASSLCIGIAFLLLCITASEAIGEAGEGTFLSFLQESLLIGGWVAMWRPLELCLYEWWPLLKAGRVLRKLSRMPVHVIHDVAAH